MGLEIVSGECMRRRICKVDIKKYKLADARIVGKK
jgi:hypothetical protein